MTRTTARTKNATIAAQQQQLDQQQDVAGEPCEAASGVAGDVRQAMSGLGDQARSDIEALSAWCSGILGS